MWQKDPCSNGTATYYGTVGEIGIPIFFSMHFPTKNLEGRSVLVTNYQTRGRIKNPSLFLGSIPVLLHMQQKCNAVRKREQENEEAQREEERK